MRPVWSRACSQRHQPPTTNEIYLAAALPVGRMAWGCRVGNYPDVSASYLLRAAIVRAMPGSESRVKVLEENFRKGAGSR